MEFKVRIPFVHLLGMELLRFDPDQAELALDLREDLTNSWGVAHGGVTMTLLDVAMAHAARTPATPGGEPPPSVATIEMKTSFVRPGTGRLTAEGRRLHRTSTLAFCEGWVRNEAGELVGHATGTFKYLRGLPVGGRKVQRPNASD
ncbi:MAG: PaaI family thioesterase [Rubrivivax sp.]